MYIHLNNYSTIIDCFYQQINQLDYGTRYLIVRPSKSCNKILCISYDYLIPWFTISSELFWREALHRHPCCSPCSWQAVLACFMHLPIAISYSYSCTLLGGMLSPLVGSTGPGHDHVYWPTNEDYLYMGSTFVEVWVDGRKTGIMIPSDSFLAPNGSKLQHWLKRAPILLRLTTCQNCACMILLCTLCVYASHGFHSFY